MITRQKVCAIICMVMFLAAVGTIENYFGLSMMFLAVMGAAAAIGGLDKKRTDMKNIARDYKLKEGDCNG